MFLTECDCGCPPAAKAPGGRNPAQALRGDEKGISPHKRATYVSAAAASAAAASEDFQLPPHTSILSESTCPMSYVRWKSDGSSPPKATLTFHYVGSDARFHKRFEVTCSRRVLPIRLIYSPVCCHLISLASSLSAALKPCMPPSFPNYRNSRHHVPHRASSAVRPRHPKSLQPSCRLPLACLSSMLCLKVTGLF